MSEVSKIKKHKTRQGVCTKRLLLLHRFIWL